MVLFPRCEHVGFAQFFCGQSQVHLLLKSSRIIRVSKIWFSHGGVVHHEEVGGSDHRDRYIFDRHCGSLDHFAAAVQLVQTLTGRFS